MRRVAEGHVVAWLLVTGVQSYNNWSLEQKQEREKEIKSVRERLGLSKKNFFSLDFATTQIDQVSMSDLIDKISRVFHQYEPDEVFLPHMHDVHSDHRIVSTAVIACTKWFRHPGIKRILSYETLSETDFILDSEGIFKPNVFIDISSFLEKKLELLRLYKSELSEFPFPRSEISLRALAQLRGAQSGHKAAEAFQLLREIS